MFWLPRSYPTRNKYPASLVAEDIAVGEVYVNQETGAFSFHIDGIAGFHPTEFFVDGGIEAAIHARHGIGAAELDAGARRILPNRGYSPAHFNNLVQQFAVRAVFILFIQSHQLVGTHAEIGLALRYHRRFKGVEVNTVTQRSQRQQCKNQE